MKKIREACARRIQQLDRLLAFIRALFRWWPANTMEELLEIKVAELTARRNDPRAPVDPARTEMRDAQIALTRAGMLVIIGQNGGTTPLTSAAEEIGTRLEHRAYVHGVMHEDFKNFLNEEIYHGRIRNARYAAIPDLFNPENPATGNAIGEPADGVLVTRIVRPGADDAELEFQGAQLTANQLWEMFPVKPNVAYNLHDGWLVVIFSRDFGPSHLFEDLHQAAERWRSLLLDDDVEIHDARQ